MVPQETHRARIGPEYAPTLPPIPGENRGRNHGKKCTRTGPESAPENPRIEAETGGISGVINCINRTYRKLPQNRRRSGAESAQIRGRIGVESALSFFFFSSSCEWDNLSGGSWNSISQEGYIRAIIVRAFDQLITVRVCVRTIMWDLVIYFWFWQSQNTQDHNIREACLREELLFYTHSRFLMVRLFFWLYHTFYMISNFHQ